jgi:uncharacterized damage-inducible protein DinB
MSETREPGWGCDAAYMNKERLLLISDIPGFTPQIGRLGSMMNYARWTTLQSVEGLTTAELDHLYDEQSNSIGALLRHIAAVEVAYQARSLWRRELSPAELSEWEAALDLGERGRREIRGFALQDHMEILNRVRSNTLRELAKRDDRWLHEEVPFWGGRPANNWFQWFHVLEDEINHRGQIRWLRKRLPAEGNPDNPGYS